MTDISGNSKIRLGLFGALLSAIVLAVAAFVRSTAAEESNTKAVENHTPRIHALELEGERLRGDLKLVNLKLDLLLRNNGIPVPKGD